MMPELPCPNCKHPVASHRESIGCTTPMVREGLGPGMCMCDMKPDDLRPKPVLIEEHVRMNHAGCGGTVAGILGQRLICSECGAEMVAMVGRG